jgi:phosphoglycolate phosphatase
VKKDFDKNKYRDTKKSLKENFPNFFGEDANRAYSEYLKYYAEYAYNKVSPVEKANEFLNFCNQNKIDLYIISNKEKSLLLKEVEFCFPNISFKKILGNGDAPQNKPNPAPVFVALDDVTYDVNRDNVWLIGDTKQDTECAYNAEIQPILLGKGKFMEEGYVKDKINSLLPLLIFEGFNEIIDYIQMNNGYNNK